jgi:hypothetical protein
MVVTDGASVDGACQDHFVGGRLSSKRAASTFCIERVIALAVWLSVTGSTASAMARVEVIGDSSMQRLRTDART